MPPPPRFPLPHRRSGIAQHAFTLLELMVVLVLVSIMMALTMPRFRNVVLTDPLKRSARQVIAVIKEVRLRAAGSPKGCGLVIKIDEGDFALYCPRPPLPAGQEGGGFDGAAADLDAEASDEAAPEPVHLLTLAESSRIKSVWNGDMTRFTIGEVTLWVNADGLMEPCVINLSDGGDELGLTVSPFLSDIRIDDQAVVPEDFTGSEALL